MTSENMQNNDKQTSVNSEGVAVSLSQQQEANSLQVESATEPVAPSKLESKDSFPNLQELYEAKEIENPDAVVPVEAQMGLIGASLTGVDERVKSLEEELKQKRADLEKVRGELGISETAQELPEEKTLEGLLEERRQLEAQKEDVENIGELEEVLKSLADLSKSDLQFIILNGTMPNGEQLKTASGKPVKEDVAKSLAQAAEEGATQITKAILKTVLGVVKGIVKGVFAVLKREA